MCIVHFDDLITMRTIHFEELVEFSNLGSRIELTEQNAFNAGRAILMPLVLLTPWSFSFSNANPSKNKLKRGRPVLSARD